jgi:hypothetical protein
MNVRWQWPAGGGKIFSRHFAAPVWSPFVRKASPHMFFASAIFALFGAMVLPAQVPSPTLARMKKIIDGIKVIDIHEDSEIHEHIGVFAGAPAIPTGRAIVAVPN